MDSNIAILNALETLKSHFGKIQVSGDVEFDLSIRYDGLNLFDVFVSNHLVTCIDSDSSLHCIFKKYICV